VLDVNVSTSHYVSILSQKVVWQPENVVHTVLILVMLLFL